MCSHSNKYCTSYTDTRQCSVMVIFVSLTSTFVTKHTLHHFSYKHLQYNIHVYLTLTIARSSSNSKHPMPSNFSRLIRPFHCTQTPFIINGDRMCTCENNVFTVINIAFFRNRERVRQRDRERKMNRKNEK